ncbi:MAG: hypothetical protein KDA22_07515, partial [Phycisphaerales bacterium]|nr:hypothetical protein [Phycisphaerales bacterium]
MPTGVAACATGWRVERSGATVFLFSPTLRAVEPANWRSILVDALRAMPRSGAVVAKRVRADGAVASMGTFVVHPKGHHELGAGGPAEAFRFPEECDAFSGGVAAIDAEAFASIDGASAINLPLGPLELSMRLRAADLRVVALPAVVATDDGELATDGPSRVAFCERWGFDWRAADLAAVRRRHAGTGLLWNVRLHGSTLPYEKYAR